MYLGAMRFPPHCFARYPSPASIDSMNISGGAYTMPHFEINGKKCGEARTVKTTHHRPCFEDCLNNPEVHPEGKHIVSICVPVKPM